MKKDQINLTEEEQMQLAIEKGKKKYGKVYKTIIADEAIIWRKLKRSEYKKVMSMSIDKQIEEEDESGNMVNKTVMDEEATYDLRQEEIAKMVILYPDNIVEDMAAVADIISTECMIKSGFGDVPVTEEC